MNKKNMFNKTTERDIEIFQVISLVCVALIMFFCRNSDRDVKLGIFIVVQLALPFLFSSNDKNNHYTGSFLLLFLWLGLFFGRWMSM